MKILGLTNHSLISYSLRVLCGTGCVSWKEYLDQRTEKKFRRFEINQWHYPMYKEEW